MANPRVFISSTCYDLSEVRDSLIDFIQSYGFEPVLSERGDVFYHPDVHTHKSCIDEVANCQLLVLIIGGRFGGEYKHDPTKSIVNAEYVSARQHRIPVFTFVKRDVHSDHFVYTKNKANSEAIVFPSIEKNEHAKEIFEFINDVRSSQVNNGFFAFDFARDIVDLLRKQWAGMFYSFLQKRLTEEQDSVVIDFLSRISEASNKVSDLVKSLYKDVGSPEAVANIEELENRAIVREFFEYCLARAEKVGRKLVFDKNLDPGEFKLWYEYIAKASNGSVAIHDDMTFLLWGGSGFAVVVLSEDAHPAQAERFSKLKTFDAGLINSVIDEDFSPNNSPTPKPVKLRVRTKRKE